MRRLSTRRSRLATALSCRAQSRTARSIVQHSPLEDVEREQPRSLARASAALALDALDHLFDGRPLPGVEHLLEQRTAVAEVPVEAAPGDAERLGQRLDPDGVGPAGRQGPQPVSIHCCAACGSGRPSSLLSRLTPPPAVPSLSLYAYRMDGGRPMKLPDAAHTSRPWRIHEIAPTSGSRTCGRCRRPAAPDDFPLLVRGYRPADPAEARRAPPARSGDPAGGSGSCSAGTSQDTGLGSSVPTLRDRLPADLRDAPARPGLRRAPLHLAVPDSRTSGRPRWPTGPSTGSCTRLGRGRGRRLPRRRWPST